MKNFKKLLVTSLATAALALSALPAQAALILTLSDGTTTETINDGGAGSVMYSGVLGAWTFNFTAGLDFSTPALAMLDLVSLNAVSSGSALSTLTIRLTNTDLTGPAGLNVSGSSHVGGTTQGTVQFSTYFNDTLVAMSDTFTTPSYSQDMYFGGLDTTSPFSLTNQVVITQIGRGATSFDMMTTIPEPASLGLLGLGLLGLGFARRRKSA